MARKSVAPEAGEVVAHHDALPEGFLHRPGQATAQFGQVHEYNRSNVHGNRRSMDRSRHLEAHVVDNEVGDRLGLIDVQLWEWSARRFVRSDRDDVRIAGKQKRKAGERPVYLELRNGLALEAFIQHDVAGREVLEKLIKFGLGRAAL